MASSWVSPQVKHPGISGIKPDIYEPDLNPVYAAMLDHYGVVADPARVRDPDRKGTVENAVQHTQNTALKGKRFPVERLQVLGQTDTDRDNYGRS